MSLGAIAQAWGAPAGSLLGGYALATLINRRATNKEADAAETAAGASSRQANTADWAAYTERLGDRLEKVETRLDASEERADRAEGRYRTAIAYIRQIAEWVAERLPGHDMPPPPPELEADL
jgi:hypothetical protein